MIGDELKEIYRWLFSKNFPNTKWVIRAFFEKGSDRHRLRFSENLWVGKGYINASGEFEEIRSYEYRAEKNI